MLFKKGLLSIVLTLIVTLGLVGGSVYAAIFNLNAAVPQMSDEIILSSLDVEEFLPAVAYNSKHNEYLVVWHTKWPIQTRDIRGARISESGQILDEFVVYENPTRDSVQPDVAYDSINDRYLVVFAFDTPGDGSNWDVYGRFIPWDGPDGSLTEFLICDWNNHQWNPKLAYGQVMEEFLVAWNNEDQAHVLKANVAIQRITASDGTLLGDRTIYDDTNAKDLTHVDVAYNLARNEYLVVYDNTDNILAIRFNGSINHDFGGEFGITHWSAMETKPAVAACHDADQYLVTFQSDQSDQGPANDAIYGRFVSGEGVPGTAYEIADTPGRQQEADVACNHAGTQFIVAWQEEYTNGHLGIWGRLVLPDGTFEDGFAIIAAYGDLDRTNAAVAGGQSTYLAVWEYDRNPFRNIHGKLVITAQEADQKYNYLPLILR